MDWSAYIINPLPHDKILDKSKLTQSADDNFTFCEICRKFSKLVENTVGKGEIARYEQFLLFPHFQKACFPGASKGVIVWEWVNPLPCNAAFWLTKDMQLWKTVWEKEKLLVTINFSFSHTVFYPMGHLFFVSNALSNVVCNLFPLGPV